MREAYLGNAVAQRAVKLVVEGVGSAPLDGSDPALVALVTARSGGQMLIETVAAQLLLHGNAYVQVLRDADGGAAELYLQAVARAFVGLAVAAGLPAQFQVGEPWWWVMPDGRPCLYDASAVAAFAPVAMASLRGGKSADQVATLEAAGACLAASTAALVAAVKGEAGGCVTHLLTYLPTVLDAGAPEAKRANMPVGWRWRITATGSRR
ncbi:hypothetical protein ASE77_08640 [Sphingomonas sp. Leaf226]|nr:hypothetical protein ASE77_08640 [Sphingomonas sp. Leaf226]